MFPDPDSKANIEAAMEAIKALNTARDTLINAKASVAAMYEALDETGKNTLENMAGDRGWFQWLDDIQPHRQRTI